MYSDLDDFQSEQYTLKQNNEKPVKNTIFLKKGNEKTDFKLKTPVYQSNNDNKSYLLLDDIYKMYKNPEIKDSFKPFLSLLLDNASNLNNDILSDMIINKKFTPFFSNKNTVIAESSTKIVLENKNVNIKSMDIILVHFPMDNILYPFGTNSFSSDFKINKNIKNITLYTIEKSSGSIENIISECSKELEKSKWHEKTLNFFNKNFSEEKSEMFFSILGEKDLFFDNSFNLDDNMLNLFYNFLIEKSNISNKNESNKLESKFSFTTTVELQKINENIEIYDVQTYIKNIQIIIDTFTLILNDLDIDFTIENIINLFLTIKNNKVDNVQNIFKYNLTCNYNENIEVNIPDNIPKNCQFYYFKYNV